jgi:hypothetical protein
LFSATGLQDAILSAMDGAFGARKQMLAALTVNWKPLLERLRDILLRHNPQHFLYFF